MRKARRPLGVHRRRPNYRASPALPSARVHGVCFTVAGAAQVLPHGADPSSISIRVELTKKDEKKNAATQSTPASLKGARSVVRCLMQCPAALGLKRIRPETQRTLKIVFLSPVPHLVILTFSKSSVDGWYSNVAVLFFVFFQQSNLIFISVSKLRC